jgi:hypothetical protein
MGPSYLCAFPIPQHSPRVRSGIGLVSSRFPPLTASERTAVLAVLCEFMCIILKSAAHGTAQKDPVPHNQRPSFGPARPPMLTSVHAIHAPSTRAWKGMRPSKQTSQGGPLLRPPLPRPLLLEDSAPERRLARNPSLEHPQPRHPSLEQLVVETLSE